MDRARDIQRMMQDFGVAVVLGSVSTLGLFDVTEKAENMDGETYILPNIPSVLIETSKADASLVAVGAAVTVGGDSYTIRDRRKESDGALLRLYLREA